MPQKIHKSSSGLSIISWPNTYFFLINVKDLYEPICMHDHPKTLAIVFLAKVGGASHGGG